MSEAADLFRVGLERFGDGDLDGYLELLSDDVEVEFPFAPPGRPERLRGRENLRRYLEPLLARIAYESITSLVVYETTSPDHRRRDDDRSSIARERPDVPEALRRRRPRG